MKKVKVLVKSFGGFRYEGKTEDLERYDIFYLKDEDDHLTKEQIWKKVWNKYVGFPIEPLKIETIEQVDIKKLNSLIKICYLTKGE